ncbi:MAG: serine/threonine-protein kinase [Acidobacteriota bacterium]|nr:serine/threonine-protein kinase [Acidobacteriota bacterium]
MPVTAGTVLGRYRLLDKAGVGGMSEVFTAEDETLKRIVAVKVILGPVAADSTFRERFLREARLVAGLEHPNILPVFDYGTTIVDAAEVSFLVMPLVSGGSLKGRALGPVPPALAISWLSAIAAALDHAHSKGILHRDVKPGNVLMDAQGRPLLADFGLARSAEVSSGLTATGTVLGTPLYMAPEQAMGQALDGRADQYALAVIAFELLAGRVPFSAESPLAVLHQHVSTPPPPLSTVLPGTGASVDAVLSRGLAKKPEDRFTSCSAFVAALGAALAVPGAAATVPQVLQDESNVATIVSAPALSPGALAAPASLSKGAPDGAPKDATRGVKVGLAALLLLSAGGGIYFLLRGMGAGRETTGVSARETPNISLKGNLAPATPSAAPSTGAEALAPGTATAAGTPTPHSPFKEKSETSRIASRGTAGGSAREDVPISRPKQTFFPPLLSGAAFSGDTQLSAAWESLDTRGRARLSREDFVSAMGSAREVLARRPTPEVRFLDAYARAGVAYADGNNAEAWQLLTMALRNSGPAGETRVLRFVADEVRAMGPNPGPDAEWVLGLAFGDARGELRSELDKAQARAPRSPRVQEARALSNR